VLLFVLDPERPEHKRIANKIRYAEKSEMLVKAIAVTAFVSSGTYRLAASLDEINVKGQDTGLCSLADGGWTEGHIKIRGILEHSARERNVGSRRERCQMFSLTFGALKRLKRGRRDEEGEGLGSGSRTWGTCMGLGSSPRRPSTFGLRC